MEKNYKIGMKSMIAVIIIASCLSMAFAVIILSKQLPATGLLVSGANFNIYSDAICTQIMTAADLGSLVRGQIVNKMCYLKYTIQPEDGMKYSYSLNNLNEITVKVFTGTSFDLEVAPNAQFGAIHTTTTTIEACKVQFTVSNTATLNESLTATVTFNANNPPT